MCHERQSTPVIWRGYPVVISGSNDCMFTSLNLSLSFSPRSDSADEDSDDDHKYEYEHGHPYHGHVLVIQSHNTVDKAYK